MLQPGTEAEKHQPSPLQSIALLLMYGNVDLEGLDEPVLNLKKTHVLKMWIRFRPPPSLLILKNEILGCQF